MRSGGLRIDKVSTIFQQTTKKAGEWGNFFPHFLNELTIYNLMSNNNLKQKEMKFTIGEKGNLTIVDDKKTLLLETDKYDLITLKEKIEEYLKSTEKTTSSVYRYNPRSKRLELTVE